MSRLPAEPKKDGILRWLSDRITGMVSRLQYRISTLLWLTGIVAVAVYVVVESNPGEAGDDPVQTMRDFLSAVQERFIPEGVAPILIDTQATEWLDREIRQEIVQTDYASARAMIARTAPARATTGAIATVDRPKVPTRVFSNEPAARAWLEEYL